MWWLLSSSQGNFNVNGKKVDNKEIASHTRDQMKYTWMSETFSNSKGWTKSNCPALEVVFSEKCYKTNSLFLLSRINPHNANTLTNSNTIKHRDSNTDKLKHHTTQRLKHRHSQSGRHSKPNTIPHRDSQPCRHNKAMDRGSTPYHTETSWPWIKEGGGENMFEILWNWMNVYIDPLSTDTYARPKAYLMRWKMSPLTKSKKHPHVLIFAFFPYF